MEYDYDTCLPIPAERKSIRKTAGMPAHVLATRIGVSPASIHGWEKGDREPNGLQRRAYRQALARLAGISIKEARSRWSNDS